MSGDGHGIQTRRAEAADGRTGHIQRQAGKDGDVAADVEALRAFREAGTDNDIVDLGGVERRGLLDDVLHATRHQVVGSGHVE